ncbi:MAG: SOS response-associated peptidase [Stellaceae bacterium]
MCGRYLLQTPSGELRRVFGFVEQPNLAPRYNIAPTQAAPVVRQRREPAGERTLRALRWGLVPARAKDLKSGPPLINMRAETVQRRFAAAFHQRRCLVPADGFYEWHGEGEGRQPYLIARRDGAPFAFAGLWERWTPPADTAAPVDSFAILTTAANALLRPLHERMPVIVPEAAYARWLDRATVAETLGDLLHAAPDEVLRYVPVGPRVSNWRVDDAGLIEPVGPESVWAG